jgi:hypothetical protein
VDRTAAVEFARLLDVGKAAATPSGTFFVRTTGEVGQAIDWANDQSRISILRRHLSQIENPRLRDAFRAAVGPEAAGAPRSLQTSSREYLWRGLPPSPIRSRLTGVLRPGRNLFVVYAKDLRFASMAYADRDHILRAPAAWSLQVRGSFSRTRYRFAGRLRKADAGRSRPSMHVHPVPRCTGRRPKEARCSWPHCQSLSWDILAIWLSS